MGQVMESKECEIEGLFARIQALEEAAAQERVTAQEAYMQLKSEYELHKRVSAEQLAEADQIVNAWNTLRSIPGGL